jgi:Domain of unknown function (DUF4136)
MTPLRAFGVVALLLVGGCSSIEVRTGVDPEAPFETYHHYHFYWYAPPGDAGAAVAPSVRERAHDAAERILARKGYVESRHGDPEFVVRVRVRDEHVRIAESVEEQEEQIFEDPDLPDASRTSDPRREPKRPALGDVGPGNVGIEPVDIDELEVGDVLVEVFDAGSDRAVWWGVGRGIVTRRTTDEELEAALEKTLESFPAARARP